MGFYLFCDLIRWVLVVWHISTTVEYECDAELVLHQGEMSKQIMHCPLTPCGVLHSLSGELKMCH